MCFFFLLLSFSFLYTRRGSEKLKGWLFHARGFRDIPNFPPCLSILGRNFSRGKSSSIIQDKLKIVLLKAVAVPRPSLLSAINISLCRFCVTVVCNFIFNMMAYLHSLSAVQEQRSFGSREHLVHTE